MIAGLLSCVLVAFPAGDGHGKLLAKHQPVTLAAMEGLFEGGPYAELAIIGQPNVAARKLENPIVVPAVLSFLAYGSFGSTVKGLNDFPRDQWPDNVELLYYSYHIMVGLGTLLTLTMGVAALLLWRGKTREDASHVVGADAGFSLSVHRHHGRLVDGGARTPAVDRPRLDAHGRSQLATSQFRRRGLYPAGLCRDCICCWDFFSSSRS